MSAGLVKRNRALPHGIKLLGDARDVKVDTPLTIEVAAVSAGAAAAVESAGGRVVRVYHTALGLRAHLLPHKFDNLPRFAAVPPVYVDKGYVHPDDAPSASEQQ
eukprot:TRINITY_DN450_c0_g1_i1.p3 TRINITY_DN450_c0_g1~~TRINITY_DN450_c0_g1_i1.p3  ORF type:complete len:104 (-),score=69.33 TRINITY_DN450_c0_g1_i1:13-324(-)